MSRPAKTALPAAQPRIKSNLVALAAVCLSSLMFGLEISSVPVILPTLETVLHGDFKGMQWIMNAYTIACTTVLMGTGTLADRFGRKRIYLISVVLFGATSLLCGLAQSVPMLIAGRLLQGASGGAMLICQVAVLSHQFQQGQQRAKAFSVWGIVFGIGLGFGPIVGGAIVALSSWQWVFLVHALISIVTLALIAHGVRESRDPHADTLDVAGIVTLSLSVFGIAYWITQGSDFGFASPTGLAIGAAIVVGLVAFVLAEKLSRRPMFDVSVLKIRNFSGALLGSMGMNFSFWPFMIYLPIYFQICLGYDSVAGGLALLAYTLPTLVFPPLGERLALRYGPGAAIPCGLFTIGLGLILMRLGSGAAHPGWLTLLPGCLIAGAGLGLTNTPVTNTTTGSVPSARAGMASGIDMSARMISLAINIALMGWVLVSGIRHQLSVRFAGQIDASLLERLAQSVASGNAAALAQRFPQLAHVDPSGATVHAALAHGFGSVMLYGGIGAWVLAAASFALFNGATGAAARETGAHCAGCDAR
jgi:EmrB/QacA subfamily drug resistance transporter